MVYFISNPYLVGFEDLYLKRPVTLNLGVVPLRNVNKFTSDFTSKSKKFSPFGALFSFDNMFIFLQSASVAAIFIDSMASQS